MVWQVDSPEGVQMVAEATGKTPAQVRRLVDHYTRLHWGRTPARIIRIDDPLLPDSARMGELVGLYLRDGNDDYVGIEFPREGSHLAVHEPTERLFMVLPDAYMREVRDNYREQVRRFPHARLKLADLAAGAPGVQNRRHPWGDDFEPWPNVTVVPLGVVTHILYHTNKVGDGDSTYIHEFGEVSGKRPVLGADSTGRLWLAGGDYTTPEEGITN